MIGVSGTCIQFLCGVAPSTSILEAQSNVHVKSRKKRCYFYLKKQSYPRISVNCLRANQFPVDLSYYGSNGTLRNMCQCADGVAGITSEDSGNRAWLKEVASTKGQAHSEVNAHKTLDHEGLHTSRKDNGGIKSNDDKSAPSVSTKQTSHKKKGSSVEDEAWRLLQESVVHYCGSPVGTIAAKDPSDGNALNYDQVFIRDFIPSGIAFLLKGEYDIVRNFILHTLQLQSWEKTMDCHSPGQGLMPASFKVRTVPLDGDDSLTEEVLDPDFGEAAIGRVAPVDSGLWWIILLRAYGKCSGDLSLQERIDVQTGIKMILKLCLADGFDMFPTLLVTDGSCMIDRRMGIHGHPLEIQVMVETSLNKQF